MKKASELHKMGNCSYYKHWVEEDHQMIHNMFDPEWNQICPNCRAQKFGESDAIKKGYPKWQLSDNN